MTTASSKVFLIEDDMLVASVMKQALSRNEKLEVFHFTSASECMNNLHSNPDIVVIDYNLPDEDGLSLMKKIKTYNGQIMTIICSGQESVEVVVNSYKQGANEYILKNENMVVNLENAINNLTMNVTLRKEVEFLKDQIIDRNKYSNIIGNSNPVLRVLRLIQKVEKNNMTVLVTGQSGT